jgi:endonuclease-8
VPEGDSLFRAARELSAVLTGKAALRVSLPRRDTDTRGLHGDAVIGVEARGKNLLIGFARGYSLHVHLKMNGRIVVRPASDGPEPSAHRASAVIDTAHARVVVFDAPVARLLRTRDVPRDLAFRELGPDLLSPAFQRAEAERRLRARGHLPLGVALLDQSAVAGIGNVYKSEICFNLRLNPFVLGRELCEEERFRILDHARALLHQNVEPSRRTLPDPFEPIAHERRTRVEHLHGERPVSVYERAGSACYDCGAAIERAYQGEPQRSTYYCPRCQGVSETP